MKFTSAKEKITLPGRKQCWRRFRDGQYFEDIISLWDENMDDAQPLMVPIMIDGEVIYDFPETQHIRNYCMEQLAVLPDEYKRLTDAEVYSVNISERLTKLSEKLFEQYRREYFI